MAAPDIWCVNYQQIDHRTADHSRQDSKTGTSTSVAALIRFSGADMSSSSQTPNCGMYTVSWLRGGGTLGDKPLRKGFRPGSNWHLLIGNIVFKKQQQKKHENIDLLERIMYRYIWTATKCCALTSFEDTFLLFSQLHWQISQGHCSFEFILESPSSRVGSPDWKSETESPDFHISFYYHWLQTSSDSSR